MVLAEFQLKLIESGEIRADADIRVIGNRLLGEVGKLAFNRILLILDPNSDYNASIFTIGRIVKALMEIVYVLKIPLGEIDDPYESEAFANLPYDGRINELSRYASQLNTLCYDQGSRLERKKISIIALLVLCRYLAISLDTRLEFILSDTLKLSYK